MWAPNGRPCQGELRGLDKQPRQLSQTLSLGLCPCLMTPREVLCRGLPQSHWDGRSHTRRLCRLRGQTREGASVTAPVQAPAHHCL